MKYLLDTHTLIWVIEGSSNLSELSQKILFDEDIKFVSVISFWEISLKYEIGKLGLKGRLPDDVPGVVKSAGLKVLDLNSEVASTFYKLPRKFHKDPFDRMLIWQAINKGLILISKDSTFAKYKKYGLRVIW